MIYRALFFAWYYHGSSAMCKVVIVKTFFFMFALANLCKANF